MQNLFLQNLNLRIMNKVGKYLVGILLGLLLCGAVVGGFFWGKNQQLKKDVVIQNALVQQVEELQAKIDAVENLNLNLNFKKDSLEYEVRKTINKLNQLRSDYDKKISDIVNYTNPELELFFRKRYSSN